MDRKKCPVCKTKVLVSPVGPRNSTLLLLGDYPGYNECIEGIPFSFRGAKSRGDEVGDILKKELGRIGIQMSACRQTNIWQHAKDEKDCDLQWHINQAMLEIKGHKYVLAMGSDVSRALWQVSAPDIYGLKFSGPTFPGVIFIACPNPATLFHGPIGEFRLAMETLKKEME